MHTGDVAIMDEEGYLRIVDRTKDMIIVGGYKVFSSKIEDIISKHPAIDAMACHLPLSPKGHSPLGSPG